MRGKTPGKKENANSATLDISGELKIRKYGIFGRAL